MLMTTISILLKKERRRGEGRGGEKRKRKQRKGNDHRQGNIIKRHTVLLNLHQVVELINLQLPQVSFYRVF